MNFAGSSRVYAIDPRNKSGWRIRRCNTQCLDVCGCGWASLRLLASFTMLLGQARIFSLPARSISESADLAARSQLPVIFHTSTTTFDVDILIQYILLMLIFVSSNFFATIFIRFPTWDKSLGQHPESKLGGSSEARWLHVRLAVCAWCSRT